VSIQTVHLGGGFGRKLELDFVQQVVEISRQAGRPVKLIWTREDDMQHDFYRPMSLHQVEGTIDANGKLSGIKAKMTSASVTARMFPPFFQNGVDPFMNEGSHNLTYKIPAIQIDTVVQELGIRVGYWRSVSHPLNAFAVESLMDELAEAAGSDPLKFRLAALEGVPRAQKVLQLAADRSGWAGKRNAVGLAQMECYETYTAVAIEVNPANPLQIRKITCVVDCGLSVHPDQVIAQAESGVIFGLTAVLQGEITVKNGAIEQSNFHDQAPLRMNQIPVIEIIVANTEGAKIGGMGEVGVPLVAPAFANAIAAATGKRLRHLPFTSV
jgi:isoquinoline 1-oxidoreductase subunit beta